MAAEEIGATVKTLHIVKEVLIAAPAEVVFQTVLEPHGPMKEMNEMNEINGTSKFIEWCRLAQRGSPAVQLFDNRRAAC